MFLFCIFFREKPQKPPSKAADLVTMNPNPPKYREVLGKLFRMGDYWKLLGVMSFNYGTVTAVMAVVDQMLKGFGYYDSGNATSATIISAMGAGLASNIVLSQLVKATRAYKYFLGLLTFGSVLAFGVFLSGIILRVYSVWIFYLLGVLLGVATIPVVSMVIMLSS